MQLHWVVTACIFTLFIKSAFFCQIFPKQVAKVPFFAKVPWSSKDPLPGLAKTNLFYLFLMFPLKIMFFIVKNRKRLWTVSSNFEFHNLGAKMRRRGLQKPELFCLSISPPLLHTVNHHIGGRRPVCNTGHVELYGFAVVLFVVKSGCTHRRAAPTQGQCARIHGMQHTLQTPPPPAAAPESFATSDLAHPWKRADGSLNLDPCRLSGRR